MGRAVPPVWASAPWDPRLLASLCTPTPSPVSGSLLQRCTPGWGRRTAAPRCLSSPREQQFLTVLSEQRSVGPHGGTAAPQIRLAEAEAPGVSDAALLGGIPAPRHFARWAAEILKTELSKQRARFLGNGRRWERCFLAPAPRAEWILAVCWQMGRRTPGRGGGGSPLPRYGAEWGSWEAGGAVGSFQWSVLGGKFSWKWGRKRRVLCWKPTRSVWAELGAGCGAGAVRAASNPPCGSLCAKTGRGLLR